MHTSGQAAGVDDSAKIEGPTFDHGKGVWVFEVESQFLNGRNKVEVLLPDRWDASRAHRVLYVLPVFPGIGGPWGDGLQVVRQLGFHNQHDLVCVSPAFDTAPFYGTHATDPRIRHEDYMLRVLVPMIDRYYNTFGTASGRLLLGFSKSGWGSFLLTLRNPDVFGYACSFHAPLMMSEKSFGIWRTAEHYGSREAMSRYVPAVWARTSARAFQDQTRLVLLGRGLLGIPWFRDRNGYAFHRLLRKLGIKHYANGRINAPHTWNRGWVAPAVDALVSLSAALGRAADNDEDPMWDR